MKRKRERTAEALLAERTEEKTETMAKMTRKLTERGRKMERMSEGMRR